MSNQENTARLLPDVAVHAQPHLAGALDWVGMADIQVPVHFDAGDGELHRASAKVGAFVNLKRPDKRGIHMSRLYLQVEQVLSAQPLTVDTLQQLLRGFLDSHKDLSDRACLSVKFEQLVRRPALRSDNSGWRSYPVTIEASLTGDTFLLELGTEVVYSSTCPASAALFRKTSMPASRSMRPPCWPGSAASRASSPRRTRSAVSPVCVSGPVRVPACI
jgi:GTP cyclohydrolase I